MASGVMMAAVETKHRRQHAVRVSVPLMERMAWSIPEWSALHGFSAATGWRLVRAGAVTVINTGGRTLITRQASEAWQIAAAAAARSVRGDVS